MAEMDPIRYAEEKIDGRDNPIRLLKPTVRMRAAMMKSAKKWSTENYADSLRHSGCDPDEARPKIKEFSEGPCQHMELGKFLANTADGQIEAMYAHLSPFYREQEIEQILELISDDARQVLVAKLWDIPLGKPEPDDAPNDNPPFNPPVFSAPPAKEPTPT